MKSSFLATNGEDTNVPIPASTPDTGHPEREPLRHLLIDSPQGVTNAIHSLHQRGYAEVGAWSPLLPTANLGEVMSILVKYIVRE